MKAIKLITGMTLMLAFLFVGTIDTNAANEKSKKVTFTSNMNCAACQGKVEGSLKDMTGVISYKTDLDSNTVMVEFDEEKTSESKIKSAINDAGFKADKKDCSKTKAKKSDCSSAKKSGCS